ncbi:hypothetical protein FDO65_10700 [Nakamurella flava]|uniref:Uncharacterized protein n=1 Tax=Nakamurella flava TaxID=2576308 RepID=A0A4U6QPG8_9ACTN|nr:hypothetical protein [Nakamurella flava]TKV61966.1 hypothetical protein FDO65_10700 [Nakamurella flava]
MSDNVDPAALVAAQLAAAGITPSAAEVATMVAATPARLAAIDALYAVPGARYEEPCLVFSAVTPA